MRKMNKLSKLMLAAALLATFSCKKKEDDPAPAPTTPPTSAKPVAEVKSIITADRTFSSDSTYVLFGNIYVQAPAKLTIQAGTIIKGDYATKGSLIVSRGAMIDAQGTASSPIVFTSNRAQGVRDRGDWAGVVILGKATTNSSQNATGVSLEGISAPTGDNGLYGGTTDNDNSGILKYARIEYAGVALSPDNELNSLTMGGVGSATEIHHIQVYAANDDAFEWFGGSVNHTHLVAISTLDDDFDSDLGYNGKVQWGLIVREVSIADVSGSRAFEASSSSAVTTRPSQPVFSNITALGPRVFAGNPNSLHNHAVRADKFSEVKVYNSIFSGFMIGFENQSSSSGAGVYEKNVITDCPAGKYLTNVALGDNDTSMSITSVFSSTVWEDIFPNSPENDVFKFKSKNLSDGVAPVLKSDFSFTPKTGITGITDVTYVGAFGTTADASWEWNSGWLNFNPQDANY